MTRPLILPLAENYRHGEHIAPHCHDRAQLIHAISGVVTVNTLEGSWVVPPGRGVWVPAACEHELRMSGVVRMRTLFVDAAARPGLPALCQVIDISPLLRELIIRAMDITPGYPLDGHEARIMALILDEIRVLPVLALHVPSPRSAVLQELCETLRLAPADNWSLGRAAELCGLSGRTLTRAFQRETGLSLVQWVRRMRLLAGLDALAAGRSVLEVALDQGYDSPSAFSAMFRRTLGVSPSVYFGRVGSAGVGGDGGGV
ncbi:helix-turn-helix transcriptional regulator [Pseudomonas fakonensis]|uniref:Helix-turn-helix transcriptional regulator n=1 Tax=Pseudomonas fakonensis TaxID=2842355 RepID=A0ABX8N0R2_9PSED|nr:helix-turn-helix transcriptional regulator [Pseudomonas fakonensis]QXH49361.1 helix-turn-helix transcriptional regulator [Pseudomonas fakonensis]